MQPEARPPYSFRDDPAVPEFDDSRIVVVMDAECALCSRAARRIARLDTEDLVRIAPMQGTLGRALLMHYRLDADDPASWLMIENGRARGSLEGMAMLFPRLHWAYAPARLVWVLPVGLRDWIYARIARNRYAVFGHGDLCALPDPEVQRRLLQ
ncbi:thiol-disulfide oxidoreductase [Roseovarius atlanticus]|uniref:Thiol-disulfide oxidoreductase n=1 Tax=Roseovarius atlanticus TaxID=1641875 RepID=A0A0T5NVF5_9RHOB|nr:DCC1-like thiol-disulfide oxidoreductase family protein [Roseovarius atlanticus]KRS12734.1 thiol-disulfide oxidoreductase [Roseovarius atlanticus]